MVAGDDYGIKAVPLIPGESPEDYREKLSQTILSLGDKRDSETIIFADILGGTPFQSAAYLSKTFNVAIVTGMNLPMLLSIVLSGIEGQTLKELVDKATHNDSIGIKTTLFNGREKINRAKLSINKNR